MKIEKGDRLAGWLVLSNNKAYLVFSQVSQLDRVWQYFVHDPHGME